MNERRRNLALFEKGSYKVCILEGYTLQGITLRFELPTDITMEHNPEDENITYRLYQLYIYDIYFCMKNPESICFRRYHESWLCLILYLILFDYSIDILGKY